MIEVFKTNITDPEQAAFIVSNIENNFAGYQANFDLADCDRILRIEFDGYIQCRRLIRLLNQWNCIAEILPDELTLQVPGFRIKNDLFLN